MHIIIVGMGEVGRHISSVLVEEDHHVVIIDNDPEVLAHAEETLDAMVLKGHGANAKTLKTAGVHKTDLFIAVTSNCEVNMLAALRAKEMGAARTIARVSTPEYFEGGQGIISDVMGIDVVINPNALIALEMHKIVRSSSAIAVEDFADNRIEMIQFPLSAKSYGAGKILANLQMPENTLITALVREDGEIIVPGGRDELRAGDELLVVGRIEQIPKVEKLFGRKRSSYTKRVIIVGGSQVGAMLAEALVNDDVEVILMDKDMQRCRELSRELYHVTVINADGTNIHVLQEENVGEVDAFIAASGDDEVNLMAGLLARDQGAQRVLALVHKPSYGPISQHLGIDAPLSPRIEIAKQVLKLARSGQVVSVAPVLDGRGEFLELIVPDDAPAAGKEIKHIGFPDSANICGIVDRTGAHVPRGDDVLEANDRVIVFTKPENREAVEKFFRKRTGLFKS